MARTNIEIDNKLVEKAIRLTGASTKRGLLRRTKPHTRARRVTDGHRDQENLELSFRA
jgi:Arc/MetJ family transcription regulator